MNATRKILPVLLGVFLCGAAAAAPPAATELEVGDLPADIQAALGPARGRLSYVSASLTRCDLDHDGSEEWLVAATRRDAAGFVQANRPTWLFVRAGTGWRRAAYLGVLVQAVVVPGAAGDGIRALSRDGARTHCALYRWQGDRLQAAACPSDAPR